MDSVNILEAKNTLSKLVDAVERGLTPEIVIARHGRPAARLVPLAAAKQARLGAAKGQFVLPDSIDTADDEVAGLFRG